MVDGEREGKEMNVVGEVMREYVECLELEFTGA